ncbi:MAG: ABC transporter ATP-binding protein [Pseudomonadota bacterium]
MITIPLVWSNARFTITAPYMGEHDQPTDSNGSPMLELKGLVRRFGAVTAVDKISLTLNQGEVLGFLGPNAAGKSTTLRMIAGVLSPSGGDALITGHSITKDRYTAQANLGYLPEGAPLYDEMAPPEFLRFIGRARGMERAARERAIERVIADARISTVTGKRIGDLSKGYRRRVGLAGAILTDPPVLLLDEPTDGLDPNQKRAVRALISRMASEKVIVITTHTLEEVSAMCTRAVIMDQGRILADDSPENLAASVPEGGLERVFMDLTQSSEAMIA